MIKKEVLNAILRAIQALEVDPELAKLEGQGWKVYKVGAIIRVDIG